MTPLSLSLSRRLPALATLALALLLSPGCVAVKSMPYETYAKIDRGAERLPPDCVETARIDLEMTGRWQSSASEGILTFWETMAKRYAPYFDKTLPAETLDAQIETLVAAYDLYPHKAALPRELLSNWPHGLRNYPYKSTQIIPQSSLASSLFQTRAARAWPLWVTTLGPTRTAFPQTHRALAGAWGAVYAENRLDIRDFWLTVALAIERQKEHLRVYAEQNTGEIDMEFLSNRPTTPLPILHGHEERIIQLRIVFGNHPVFKKDMDRYLPIGDDPAACPLPRNEVFGTGKGWTTGLFSKFSGLQWLVTGGYHKDKEQPVARHLYRQEAHGWYALPFLGYLRGTVDRYAIGQGDISGPRERKAAIWSIWPLLLYGKGHEVLYQNVTTQGSAFGIPILFAYAEVKDDAGMRATMREALHFLLYYGVSVHDRRRSYSTDAVGLGLLWTSTYNDRTGNSLNGPLWGAFGWGARNQKPVWRVFGFPIERKK